MRMHVKENNYGPSPLLRQLKDGGYVAVLSKVIICLSSGLFSWLSVPKNSSHLFSVLHYFPMKKHYESTLERPRIQVVLATATFMWLLFPPVSN